MQKSEKIIGRIHSTESFGAADGPGVRFIIFLQGCPMRCRYCHNPDTWNVDGGSEKTADELIALAERYKSYWGTDGGITVSGGEPLLQPDFLCDIMKKAKEKGINTALDTSGAPFTREEPFFSKFKEIMEYTDLVILDLKEINPQRHKSLTGRDNRNILDMAQYLSDINKPLWIRNVLVPGVTDFDEDLDNLGKFISDLKSVRKTEVLPYHSLGKFKWENLGIPYSLEDTPCPDENMIENANRRLGLI